MANKLTTLNADLRVAGRLSADQFSPPDNSVGANAISTNDPIPAEKLEHQFAVNVELFAEGTTITAVASKLIHIVRGGVAEIQSVEAIIGTQATGADRTVTVDLQLSDAGGAFATVLSSTVDIDNTTVIRTPVAGTISTAAMADGDILRLVVTVAGSAGNQAEGLLVSVQIREDAD